jgi:uncharacterized membrane protein
MAIMAPLALMMARVMPRPANMPQTDPRSLISAVVVYGVVAAAFIACGVGSVRTRRWARPLMLSVAWTWLLFGLFASVMIVALFPTMQETMTRAGAVAGPGTRAPPAGMMQAIMWISGTVMFLLYIVLPSIFILFYRSPHVRTTLEHYDPNPGWADRAPVSVFGLAVGLAVSGLFVLPMLGYGVFPFFGVLLTGPAAILATIAVAALFMIAGWLVYRLSMAGWGLTMAISVLLPIASIITMRRVGVVALYEHMGMPPDQIDSIRHNAMIQGPLMPIATAVLGAAGIVYLLVVRKFFVASAGSEPTVGDGTIANAS